MIRAVRDMGKWLEDAFCIIFPEPCLICNRRLKRGEKYICASCFQNLPFTNMRGKAGNVTERLFWDILPIVRANSFLYYNIGADSRRPFFWLKYYDLPELGVYLGRVMARDLMDTGFFDGIDMIVPLPLSKRRLKQRGYNQSRKLAEGVAQVTGLPVNEDVVSRVVDNPTQTHLTPHQRKNNVEGIFALQKPQQVEGRHILLIDDIVTTNATLSSCGRELARAGDVKISILTLGIAGKHSSAIMTERASIFDY